MDLLCWVLILKKPRVCMLTKACTPAKEKLQGRLDTWTLIFCQSMLCAEDLRGSKLLLRQPSAGQAVGGVYLPSSNRQVLLKLHLLQMKSI
jgi:hypothetical protein